MKSIARFSMLCLAALLAATCSETVNFNNPLDPNNGLMSPAQLQLLSLTEDAVAFGWRDNTTYTDPAQRLSIAVNVELSTDGQTYSPLGTLTASTSTGSLKGTFLTNTTYYFRTYASDGVKESARSNIVSGRIPFPAPTGLTVVTMTPASVTLRWITPGSIATHFVVEMSGDNIRFDSVAVVESPATSASIQASFDSSTVYLFRVAAKSSFNTSPYSNVVGTSLRGNTYLGLAFAYVPGGSFQMGNGYTVTLSSYYIGKHEVTQRQWHDVVVWKQTHVGAILNPDPSYFKGDSLPVESVTWSEVQVWIGYLNEKESPSVFRLPTEAEWQFAAQGGNETHHYFFSGSDRVEDVGWTTWDYPIYFGTRNVGLKQPNELGTYDMTGNVSEWCSDWYGDYPGGAVTNPPGPDVGTNKVQRGGNFSYEPYICTVTARDWGWSDGTAQGGLHQSSQRTGFRLVRVP